MREREHLKNVGVNLASLRNKNKRIIGQKYQLQRFSVGDVFLWCGMKARVLQRDMEKKEVWVWFLEAARTEPVKMDDLLYEFVEECPPR
jgi:hypothetical protein